MYQHIVQYYETDKMGVTHHSNYIRFMEEARVEFFNSIGFDYFEFEKSGMVSPVMGLNNIRYKRPSTAGDVLDITVNIKAVTNVFFTLEYEMKKQDTVVFTGESDHCLLSKEGKIIPSGIFIRSGNLANIKFSDKFQLKHKYKIKTIIDLRTEKEVAEKPDKKIRGIKYLNYSLINQSAEGITHEKDRQHSNNLQGLERMYEQIVLDDFAIDSLKKIFKVLTDINNFPILFHCSVGKDRTGIVTLFLLSLLDVERSKIDKDYLESNVICIPESERVYERVLEKTMNHTLANKIRLTHIVDIKYLDAAVNAINEKFGSVDNYIKDVIGITDEEKNIFKENVFNK